MRSRYWWTAALCIAALRAQVPGATVEGRVVATNGRPVAKATVVVRPPVAGDPGALPPGSAYVTETDAEGRFRIEGVAPGAYEAEAERRGYRSHSFYQTATQVEVAHFTAAEGQQIAGIELQLTPLGVISGRVLDAEGDPLANAGVQALQYGYEGGKKKLVIRLNMQSNDRGEYRLFDLFPGVYYVRATPTLGSPFMALPFASSEQRQRLSPAYYPATSDPARAAAIEVAPGGEARLMDVRVRQSALYSVRGRLPAITERTVQVELHNKSGDSDAEGGYQEIIHPDGFEVRGVAPGSYTLTIRLGNPNGQKNTLFGRAAVEVVDHDVEGVSPQFGPGQSVSGTVTVAGAVPVDRTKLTVALEPAEGDNSRPPFSELISMLGSAYARLSVDTSDINVALGIGQVAADGAFTIAEVAPDRYRIRVSGPDPVHLTSVKAGDREVKDRTIDLRQAGSKLSITVSAETGTLDGTVTDADGKPAPGAAVTLVPDPANPALSDEYKETVGDAEGRFSLQHLVPGRYSVFAWKRLENRAPADPEFRKPFAKLAIPVEVQAGGRQTVEVKSIDPVRQGQ